MTYSVRTAQNALVSILQAENTTSSSYPLSLGLSATVSTITTGNPEITPVPINQLPIVFVEVDGGPQEALSNLGRAASRDVTQTYRIYGVTHNQSAAKDQSLRLRDNITGILRNYVDLSGTCAWSKASGGQNSFKQTDSTYVHTSEILIEVTHIAIT